MKLVGNPDAWREALDSGGGQGLDRKVNAWIKDIGIAMAHVDTAIIV